MIIFPTIIMTESNEVSTYVVRRLSKCITPLYFNFRIKLLCPLFFVNTHSLLHIDVAGSRAGKEKGQKIGLAFALSSCFKCCKRRIKWAFVLLSRMFRCKSPRYLRSNPFNIEMHSATATSAVVESPGRNCFGSEWQKGEIAAVSLTYRFSLHCAKFTWKIFFSFFYSIPSIHEYMSYIFHFP